MPQVPNKPPIHSRQQSIMGQARVIEDAARLAKDPRNQQIANADVVRKAYGLTTAAATLEAKPQLRGIVIEDNVPMPPKTRGGPVLPFTQLKPGQSFFVLKTYGAIQAQLQKLKSSGCTFTFATRVVEEEGAKGVRVWRTA